MIDPTPPAPLRQLLDTLRPTNKAFMAQHPGDPPRRQPVHVVYGGGHLFRADTAAKLGEVARRSMSDHAPDPAALDQALGLGGLAEAVYTRVADKLVREPVEDFRIDFEDGYGTRPDADEDRDVAAAAREVAKGHAAGSLPEFIGIRVKPLTEELRARSLRTLRLFIATVLEAAGTLPANFVVTCPKITTLEQVKVFAGLLEGLERELGLAAGTLRFEAMIETPQNVLDADGGSMMPRMIGAAQGRLQAAHFGTYDYTASLGITAAHQRMRHPACDHAKLVMQVAFAGTGVWLSDGSTAILPVPVHSAKGGVLSAPQQAENRAGVHAAWRLHADDVRHSLAGGFYQGWDLHPAQLVSRYAAVFEFFLAGLEPASERLQNFVGKLAQATLVGDVFDDAATGQGLLNYFLRGVQSGAIGEDEAVRRSGLTVEEIRGRSFAAIVKARAKG
ncbi:MAG: phosphoenolpyruvate kinase [Candidatus Eisenbacteria bacterium]